MFSSSSFVHQKEAAFARSALKSLDYKRAVVGAMSSAGSGGWIMSWFARLGAFRTLPLFFAIGAGVEWFMIHVQIGKETFCELRFPN